jgi:methionyl aminopeptidase
MITDSAVTVVAGTAKPEVLKIIEHTREALKAGIKAAKGGNRVGDIGAAIERIAVAHGYGLVEELSGHGVGYDVHEDPYVPNFGEPGKGDRLVPCMVIAIEPIFTLGDRHIVLNRDGWTYETRDGSIATHCEHTILITKGDAEVLTIE